LVTTQAAEKVYRSLGPPSRSTVSLQVGDRAWLEWLPQETILFNAARLERRLEANVAADGRLIASEMVTFGRLARGERFASGLLLDGWRVRRDNHLIWVDALRLEGDCANLLDDRLGFSGACATATAIYVACDAPERLVLARALTAESKGWAGATVVNGMLLARFLAKDPTQLRMDLSGYLANLRHAVAGLLARPPRFWRC
jgi:urease accessory protein